MNAWIPDRKVWVGALSGALTGILVWGLSLGGVVVPERIVEHIGILMFAVGYLVSYWVPKPGMRWDGSPQASSLGSPSPPSGSS